MGAIFYGFWGGFFVFFVFGWFFFFLHGEMEFEFINCVSSIHCHIEVNL